MARGFGPRSSSPPRKRGSESRAQAFLFLVTGASRHASCQPGATREHRQALAKIAYYTEEQRGLFLMMGDIGTGKTTISQLTLNRWRAEPDRFVAAHITDPSPRTPAAFLRLVLASLGLPTMRNLLDLKAMLRAFFVEQYKVNRTVVLLIDEAQTIFPANLDTLQAIANEQSQTAKLVQVVLLAQPNFEFKLAQKPALRSRIAGGATLNPLTPDEAIDLLRHRMSVAGGDFDRIFPEAVHKSLYNATNGVPRDLCILCDAAMLNAVTLGNRSVDEESLRMALGTRTVPTRRLETRFARALGRCDADDFDECRVAVHVPATPHNASPFGCGDAHANGPDLDDLTRIPSHDCVRF